MADCAEMEAWIRELVEEIVVSALPFEEEAPPPSGDHHKRRLCFEDEDEASNNKRLCPSQEDKEWNITFLPDEIGLTQPDSSARATSENEEETVAALREQVRQLTEERDLWKKSHADAVKALEEAARKEARASTSNEFNQDDGCAMAELLW